MSQITVVAAIVDQQRVTLYKPDGSTLIIPQGDPRVRRIVDEVLPLVDRGEHATIDLTMPNAYGDFEELTKQAIRFFRVAKKVVAHIYAEVVNEDTPVPAISPSTHGSVPTSSPAPQIVREPMSKQEAVDQILAHAQPASAKDFDETATTDDETMVAVVGDTVIPGAEAVKEQLANSVNLGSSVGMENFFKRLAGVIDKRNHSAQDILRFMEKNDLPIADDGCLLVYKVLRKRNGIYYDVHTNKVPQKIGSYVCVDPSLIDTSRRNECAAGLHVARRGYIGQFGGDCCTLVKVAPEDVYVVPHGDPNKVRVAGYHVLFELPTEAWHKLKSNTPMTSNPGAAKLLGRAIKGDHTRRIEQVLITEHSGGGIKVTLLNEKGKPIKEKVAAAKALDDSEAAPKVDPKEVDKKVAERSKPVPASKSAPKPAKAPEAPAKPVESQLEAAKRVTESAGPSGRKQRLYDLNKVYTESDDHAHKVAAATELLEIRRAAKKSWASLGYPEITDILLQDMINSPAPVVSTPVTNNGNGNNRQDQARGYYKSNDWANLYELKKRSKVSWAKLGFDKNEISLIEVNKPK